MIAIGSDHGGYALKLVIMKHLEERGLEYRDFGTYNEESCHYPDTARPSPGPWPPANMSAASSSAGPA